MTPGPPLPVALGEGFGGALGLKTLLQTAPKAQGGVAVAIADT